MVDDSIIVVGTCNIWERWMHIHMSRLLFFHYSGIALFRVLIHFLFSSFLSAYANAARSAHGSEENLIHWSFSPWDRNSLFCVRKKKKVLFLHILLTTDSLILLRIVGQHLLSCKTIAKKKRKQPRHPTFRTLALGRLNHCEVSIGRTATMQQNGGKCVRVSRATCF